jgi:GntR family transcriptional regulator, rspAB operon transcriptional repressor
MDGGMPQPVRRRIPVAAKKGRARTSTVSARVYQELRADIVAMRRKPGEPISEKEISGAYGVSRTPVREAVLRLADEGLIEIFPQSGTYVGRIPLSVLPDAIIVRKALEEAAARYAAERATPDQIAALQVLIERQRVLAAAADSDNFHAADEEFHAAIAEVAGHPRIWSVIQQVKVRIDRYRRITLPTLGRMTRVVEEHGAIVAAIEAHDPERAVRMMRFHLDGLDASIEDIRNLAPDFFIEDRK